MTKSELVKAVADKCNFTIADAGKAVEAFLDVTKECIKSGDELKLVGFGTFYRKESAERTGRNPQTGEDLVIPARKSGAFKAGSELKNL